MTASPPRHLDQARRYLPLKPATERQARRPAYGHPTDKMDEDTRRVATEMWDGYEETAESWAMMTAPGVPFHWGVLPERGDLLVVDCDVKTYDPHSGFVFHGNTATPSVPVVKHGIQDLVREVTALGHEMTELATYTVRTKSAGYHLYFRQNPEHRVRSTKRHRHDWRVDVIASPSNWVAAPPTPGYELVRDLPMRVMPVWLAQWLDTVNTHLPPLGGRQRVSIDAELWQHHVSLLGAGDGVEPGTLLEMRRRYATLVLQTVELANHVGGWNNAIYDATHLLLELGLGVDLVTNMVLAVAGPDTLADEARAADTIASAVNKQQHNGEWGHV